MIHKPASGEMWDPCVVRHEGTYYLFSMLDGHSMYTASSTDGVHWTPLALGIDHAPFGVFKMFIGRCHDRFVLDHGSHSGTGGDVVCCGEVGHVVRDDDPSLTWDDDEATQ